MLLRYCKATNIYLATHLFPQRIFEFNISLEYVQTSALCVCPLEDCLSPKAVWTVELWEIKGNWWDFVLKAILGYWLRNTASVPAFSDSAFFCYYQ